MSHLERFAAESAADCCMLSVWCSRNHFALMSCNEEDGVLLEFMLHVSTPSCSWIMQLHDCTNAVQRGGRRGAVRDAAYEPQPNLRPLKIVVAEKSYHPALCVYRRRTRLRWCRATRRTERRRMRRGAIEFRTHLDIVDCAADLMSMSWCHCRTPLRWCRATRRTARRHMRRGR